MMLWVHTADASIGDNGGFLDVHPEAAALALIAAGKAQRPQDTPLRPVTEPIVEEYKGIAAFVIAVGAPPISLTPPVVTGVPQSSNRLTCNPGTWDGAVSIAYQWFKDGTIIVGQTGNQLTLNSTYIGSTVRCDVTATNPSGDTTVASNDTLVLP